MQSGQSACPSGVAYVGTHTKYKVPHRKAFLLPCFAAYPTSSQGNPSLCEPTITFQCIQRMDRDGLIRRLRHWAFRWIGRPTAGASNASLPVASRAENVNPVIPSEDNIPPMARRSAQIPENHAREESVGSSTPPELRTQDRDSTADQQTGGRLATISQPSTRLSDDDEHHSGKGQAEGKNMGFELKNVPRSGDTESAVSDFDSAYSDLKKLWIRTMAAYHINIGLTDEEAVQPAITDRLNSDRRSNLHSSYHMVRLPLGLEMLYRRFRMRFGESSVITLRGDMCLQ